MTSPGDWVKSLCWKRVIQLSATLLDQEIKELRLEILGLRKEVQRIQEHLFGEQNNPPS